MNPFKGMTHMVKVFQAKDGKGLRSLEPKRPAGMSARQFKKAVKLSRRTRIQAAQKKVEVAA
jgi:hypothetical protein